MGVVEKLASVTAAYPQVRAVAFADLSSSMVLASQGRANVTQEHLDRLCREARTSFDDPLFGLSVQAFGEPHSAVVLGPETFRVFLRSEDDPADAICCVCDHGIDLTGFLAKLRETLHQISSGV